jgi:small subunit ribosomal protein S20
MVKNMILFQGGKQLGGKSTGKEEPFSDKEGPTGRKEERNKVERSKLRSIAKSVEAAVQTGEKDTAAAVLLRAVKTIGSARSKGIIHKNNAARKISKLTKKVNAISRANA